jgi:NAD(P)-dependent dehydrogenase (short-subunit alcohol dehydrogenase family)
MSAEEKQMAGWASDGIPDQSGKTVLVTGGNSGLGYETVLQLARKGARVLLAARDRARGTAALERLGAGAPGRQAELAQIDLADLTSVERFAAGFLAGGEGLDLLINNAGVMAIPQRETTTQGYERQFGTNHLGHFALTGLLLDRMLATPGSRVVTVASMAARIGRMRFSDLQGERRYGKWSAYGQSKLANQLFALELDRRLAVSGSEVLSVAAHPGYAATNLAMVYPQMKGSRLGEWVARLGNVVLAQSAADGALPILYAATSDEVRGGQFFGPDGLMGMRGKPTRVPFVHAAYDPEAALRLWRISEELTGVRPDLQAGSV